MWVRSFVCAMRSYKCLGTVLLPLLCLVVFVWIASTAVVRACDAKLHVPWDGVASAVVSFFIFKIIITHIEVHWNLAGIFFAKIWHLRC